MTILPALLTRAVFLPVENSTNLRVNLPNLDKGCRGAIIKKSMENIIQKKKRKKRDKEIRALYPALTLEEIGKKYNLCRERVRQIIKGRKNKITK